MFDLKKISFVKSTRYRVLCGLINFSIIPMCYAKVKYEISLVSSWNSIYDICYFMFKIIMLTVLNLLKNMTR